ncbi:hypothetical protein SDC9_212457 [bioreactor metagenome]|uniref:Uncharacterized protein n=1 Tax=bioreactor metagenome TaxID=1076179 RepID=A0A645JM32_9ZZZZ
MDKYLVTYEYKVSDGYLVNKKVTTKILSLEDLEKLTKENSYYDDYINVLFCQKL